MNPGLTILLILVFGLFGYFLLRLLLRGDRYLSERLTTYAGLPSLERRRGSRQERRWLTRLRLWINRTLTFLSSEELALQLTSANWPLTVSEYMVIRFSLVVVGFLVGWWLADFILTGVGVAVLVYMVPGVFLRMGVNRRRRKFERQLVDVLVLITGAVKAGFSLLQAMEVVVNEIDAPSSEEYRRVLQEVGLGRPLSEALGNMAKRMDNKDLDLLITAINIQYQVGGNLTTMLSAVTETIRERVRLFGEVRALTSQQRMSSYILSMIPIGVAAAMFLISPDYMRGMFNREFWWIPAIAGTLMLTGVILIQRMVKIEI